MRNLIALILAVIVYASVGISWETVHIIALVFILQVMASLDFKLFGRGSVFK